MLNQLKHAYDLARRTDLPTLTPIRIHTEITKGTAVLYRQLQTDPNHGGSCQNFWLGRSKAMFTDRVVLKEGRELSVAWVSILGQRRESEMKKLNVHYLCLTLSIQASIKMITTKMQEFLTSNVFPISGTEPTNMSQRNDGSNIKKCQSDNIKRRQIEILQTKSNRSIHKGIYCTCCQLAECLSF